MQRASRQFWLITILSVLGIIAVTVTHGATLIASPFILALIGNAGNWFSSVAFIPDTYMLRLKGGMNTAVVGFERSIGHELDHLPDQQFKEKDFLKNLLHFFYNNEHAKNLVEEVASDHSFKIDVNGKKFYSGTFFKSHSEVSSAKVKEVYENMYDDNKPTML